MLLLLSSKHILSDMKHSGTFINFFQIFHQIYTVILHNMLIQSYYIQLNYVLITASIFYLTQ